MDTKLHAAIDLLNSARGAMDTRHLAIGPLEPYTESVDHAVASALEFASALLMELVTDDEPFQEIGEEPMSHPEAVRLIPRFIERCCEIILTEQPPLPCTCMAVRAQTFACILKSTDELAG